MNRRVALLVLIAIVVSCWYLVRFEGDPKSLDPLLVVPLHEAAPAWRSQPSLIQNVDEPAAIYIVSGVAGADGLFDALRVDVHSGARSSAHIRIGPGTAYIPFDSAELTGIPAIEFHGLTHRRPTLHLLVFPGPGGPGLHFVDSATGVVLIVAGAGPGKRNLCTITLINSSKMPEIRSLLWSNASRRLAAFLWRETDSWTLYLFSLTATQT